MVSSSTGMYYDDELIREDTETPEESSISLGMIMGIVVGVAAVIVIIIFVCYKCRNNKVDNLEFEDKGPEKLPDHS